MAPSIGAEVTKLKSDGKRMRRSVELGNEREDHAEDKPAADRCRDDDDRLRKRWGDWRHGLVQDGDVGKRQLALQSRLRRSTLARIQFIDLEREVSLKIAEVVALRLGGDQRLLSLSLGDLERRDLALRGGDLLFQMLFRFLDSVRKLLAQRRKI